MNQLSVLSSVSGRIMLGGEPKGCEVTEIRSHREELEEKGSHKGRRLTKPSKGTFLEG